MHALVLCNEYAAKRQKKQQKVGAKNFIKLTTCRDGPVKSTETRQG